MQIERHLTVQAPPNKVWDVLGRRFDEVHLWASSVERSAGAGPAQVPGAPTAGRTCQTELGPFKESIVEFDESNQVLAYTASGEKMPFFVKGLRNRWSLSAAPGGHTRVDMLMTADLAFPFSVFMAPVMKLQMGRILTFAIEELKYFVETGEPHPRKLRARQTALRAA
ncbi:MAG: SRPBCC family protein [Acidobacteriota bacterium]